MQAWNEDYRIGVSELDSQHLILFSIINQIDINIQSGQPAELIEDVLGALDAYVEYHFSHEEALMRAHGYPEVDSHAAEHQTLVKAVQALHQAHGDPLERALKVRKFAIDWLIDHILVEDAGFADYMAGRHA